MSAFQELKKEIRVLEKVFHQNHARFRVKANGLDELCCHFVGKNGELFVIHCNLYESYPTVPPMWFTEADDLSVIEAVENLAQAEHNNSVKMLLKMTKKLVKELCVKQNVDFPRVIENLEDVECEEEV